MWFSLPTPELELKLRLEELGKVRIHEEIIPELLEKLAREMESDGVARHPVIVDSNTLVVLDGMHRVAALKRLGCRYLPVCLVDYQSPNVKVSCWYRLIHGDAGDEELVALLRSLGIEVQKASFEEVSGMLERRGILAALLAGETCYSLRAAEGEIKQIYSWVGRIERAFKARGLSIAYETEHDARERVRFGGALAALMAPRARKEEVIEAALSGSVFAHKTTRHVVAARPMCVDVPLKWLMGGSLDEANQIFIKHLSRRKTRRLPGGSLFEGRRYEEELWVFERNLSSS